MVWAVGVGSLKNKLILVPSALALSAFAPWAVLPLLMLGGLYLCLEGVEKLAHKWLHDAAADEAHHAEQLAALMDAGADLAALEKEKIQGAIRTDFVLSAEIIVIALGTVAGQPFATQATVLAGIGLLMTVGVYGIVAAIVKIDDLGLYLLQKPAATARAIGRSLLLAAPRLMKALTVIGTAAMFLVGGSILVHGLPALHHGVAHLAELAGDVSGIGGLLKAVTPTLLDLVAGIVAGALALLALKAGTALVGLGKGAAA